MKTNLELQGETYYKHVGEKNEEAVKKQLAPHVELSSPLAIVKGRDAVLESTKNFMKTFHSLTIRAKFGREHQAMIVYDVDIPGISSQFPGASLLTFENGLITKIQLFYDASHFIERKAEIFNPTRP
jgi:hypothetical protein